MCELSPGLGQCERGVWEIWIIGNFISIILVTFMQFIEENTFTLKQKQKRKLRSHLTNIQ